MRYPLGVVLSAALVLPALPARALEILSDSEVAERERKRKLEAAPVLSCRPLELSASAARGETVELRLTIANGGGQVLRWSLSQLPPWLAADAMAGELRYEQSRAVVLHARTQLVAAGSARAEILVEAPGAEGSPVLVPVSIALRSEPPAERPFEPPVEPRGGRAPAPAQGTPRKGFGVRAGFLLPTSGAKAGFDSAMLLGAQYRVATTQDAKVSLELGVDMMSPAASEEGDESSLTAGSAGAIFRMGGSGGGGWYLVSGLGGLLEKAEDGKRYGTALLDVGGGVLVAGGKIDIRLKHSVLLGGENVPGMTLLSAGYHF